MHVAFTHLVKHIHISRNTFFLKKGKRRGRGGRSLYLGLWVQRGKNGRHGTWSRKLREHIFSFKHKAELTGSGRGALNNKSLPPNNILPPARLHLPSVSKQRHQLEAMGLNACSCRGHFSFKSTPPSPSVNRLTSTMRYLYHWIMFTSMLWKATVEEIAEASGS